MSGSAEMESAGVLLRPVSASDRSDFVEMASMSHQYYAELLSDSFLPLSEESWHKRFDTALADGDSYCVVMAVVGGMRAGFAEYYFRRPQRLRKEALICVLDNIFVRRQYRGSGVSAALLRYVEEEAVFRGAEAIELEVAQDNSAALSLYARAGFSARSRVLVKRMQQEK